MSAPFEDIEARLRAALAPIEPPMHLQARLEETLGSLVEFAAEELEAWELEAIKDPRNWPRAALAPGRRGGRWLRRRGRARRAAHASQRKRAQARGKRDLAGRAMREARKVFGELSRGH